MIPPRLAYYIQSLVTRKLLESPVFNRLVIRTEGFLSSIRQGLVEGWQESEMRDDRSKDSPSSEGPENDSVGKNYDEFSKSFIQKQRGPEKTTAHKETDDYLNATKERERAERNRIENEKKLKEILEKLRS
ncbi:hypothetical protein PPACK8108_LOCUS22135 [Phakopsora pachyrhizi]|uniref:Uncharacterized protein n=1 Tax=Phakopsora pachyrhizi TaxID=170000 RepID=A0AAV0BLY7_PHAPC|nr:hypothetical protein PPACK8108_LOCUS22135 [Phakopsora pachyrhizi]